MHSIISMFITAAFFLNSVLLFINVILVIKKKKLGVEGITPEQIRERAQYAFFPIGSLPYFWVKDVKISTFTEEKNLLKKMCYYVFFRIIIIFERNDEICRAALLGVVIEEPK